MDRVDILGYFVSAGGLDSDVLASWKMMVKGERTHHIACANPHSIVVGDSDREFKCALKNADLLLPDGIGVVLASKILNRPVKERVAGNEFFIALSERANDVGGIKYYFLGSENHTLDLIVKRMKSQFPNIDVCGTYSPPFKEEFTGHDNKAMLEAVNKEKPDVLWVGMTAPKQEKWVEQNKSMLQVPIVASIGAVFDFYAGTRKRAPQWVCDMGLEWLPRLLREPRRLIRRNFISTPSFLASVLKARLRDI